MSAPFTVNDKNILLHAETPNSYENRTAGMVTEAEIATKLARKFAGKPTPRRPAAQ
jgi:hypothetical protein